MKKIVNSKILYLSNFIFKFIKSAPEEKLKINFLMLFGIILFSSLVTALSPVALKFSIDSFNLNSNSAIRVTGILLLLYVLSQGLARILTDFQWSIYGRIEQKIHRKIRMDSLKHISNLPISTLHKYSSGQLIQSVNNGIRSVSMFMQSFLQVGLLIFFQIVGISLVVITFYDVSFLLIILVGVSLYVFFFLKGNSNIAIKNQEVIESQNEIGASFQSSIQYPDSNKYLNSYKDYLNIIDKNSRRTQLAWTRYYDTSIQSSLITTLIFITTLGAITFLAYKKLLAGSMTTGDFVLMVTYVLQLVKPIEAIGQVLRQIDQSKNLLDNFNKINNLDEEGELWKGKGKVDNKTSIVFDNVSFTYPGKEKSSITNISFKIKEKQKVAVVGPTGAGKSTLIKLLSGFYDNYSGKILLGDTNIQSLDIKSIRENISVISQESNIYNLPIWQNITIGTDYSKDDAIRVAKEIGIDKFISVLPEGYDTVAGEHGVKFSGGERQRIALARAILRKSSIILLDEPTSSLDVKTENNIMNLIFDIFKDKTILIIAHRLQSIVNVDKIFVVDNGAIVEEGSYNDLMKNDFIFSSLVNLNDIKKIS
ncbi:ABC transporter ATP-binding protein [Acinetobacter lactucae]|uniref:ABC transporter ATP-binding protein n=1 Tax=Acinetobacter lactucae TaxID=1785128 RepID=UPI00124EC21D|nr:ABC transporter ATP-binding protein [Acinetobacter lactucae]